nr:WD40 repeat domain-containing protein [Candidatus Njordarchaeum guaymaensis]
MKGKTLALSLSFLIVLIACLQIPIFVNAGVLPPPPPAELLWMDKEGTNDIALSKDGQYVAAVGPIEVSTELRFYGRSSENPIWTYYAPGDFWSVAISADGSCVAAGNGSHVFFWNNAKSRTPGDTDPTWTSVNLGGPIEHRCLAISDDGNYLVAGGTGPNVFYWSNAKGISPGTINLQTTWDAWVNRFVEAVDISSNGNYVVVGFGTNVSYWKGATSLTGHHVGGTAPPPDWTSKEPDNGVSDIAVSDDGNYVAAATFPTLTVYYWAGAGSRTGTDEPSTWYGGPGVSFTSIDMSSDGDSVIAGALIDANPGFTGTVYFWGGARGLTGKPQNPKWTHNTTSQVIDVAIDAAGDYMAAVDDAGTPYVYFFDSTGDLKWTYEISEGGPILSISSDGGTLAIGTGGLASRYLVSTGFKTLPPRAVGGHLIAVDKLALLSPWIAVALTTLALTVFAAKRKRKP